MFGAIRIAFWMIPEAVHRVHRSLRPGGWVLFATVNPSADPLALSLARLRTVEWGACPWTPTEATRVLEESGFEDVVTLPHRATDLLGFEAQLSGVPGAKWIEEHGKAANVVMRCRELTDVLSACVAGIGLAVLPCMAAALEPSLERLTTEILGSSRLSVVYRKEMLVAQPVRAVIEFVTEVMRQHADRMSGRV